MEKRTFKQWLFYKYKKGLVRLRNKSLMIASILEVKRKIQLNEVQQPLFEICLKLINDSNTELRHNLFDDNYQIENDKYLIIIKSSSIASEENYSISLVETKNPTPIYVDMPFPYDYVKQITLKFNKEVQKRMKTRQAIKTTRVSTHLNSILKEMNDEKKFVN
jgi:hypothetical protein